MVGYQKFPKMNRPARCSRSALRRRLERRELKTERMQGRIDRLLEQNRALAAELKQADQQRERARQELIWQQASQSTSVNHPLQNDRPLPRHQFGVKLIAASIELAKRIGFRATEFVWAFLF